jgi:hypothetical protein
MSQEQIIYSKEEEDDLTEYHYYIIKKGENEYYVKAEIINYDEPVPGVERIWEHDEMCLKIRPEEVKKVIELLERGIEWFEGEYASRDDWEEC